ncbi:MAG: hypothetical protein ACTSR8_07025 [Promethearchaeota archaeon]
MRISFERFRNRYLSTGVTKEMDLVELRPKSDKGYFVIFDFSGNYKYSHYLNAKYLGAIFGALGFKLYNIDYYPDTMFFRFEMETTDNYFNQKPKKSEKIALMKDNVKLFTNFYRTLQDSAQHTWLKVMSDENSIIKFQTKETFNTWIMILEQDLKKYGSEQDFELYILKFFEHLNWIKIIDESKLDFQVKLNVENNKQEFEFLREYLSDKYSLEEENSVFII